MSDTPAKGHNSRPGGIAGEQLRSFIERVERCESERADLAADIREIYAEAKSFGFDTPTMRAVVRERKQDPDKRLEREALLDLYRHALGMAPEREDDE